jgi:iron(III) transport system permease protein
MELARRTVIRSFQFPKIEWSWIPLALLVGVLVLLLAYPLALLLIKSFVVSRPGQPNVWSITGWVEAFTDPNLAIAIGNTFYLAVLRIVITSVLAIFFAWIVARTDTPLKSFIEIALWLGFFLPLLPMTMGWIMLLDPYNGLINKLLMNIFALGKPPFDIYSYWGIVWCHIAFSIPSAFCF